MIIEQDKINPYLFTVELTYTEWKKLRTNDYEKVESTTEELKKRIEEALGD